MSCKQCDAYDHCVDRDTPAAVFCKAYGDKNTNELDEAVTLLIMNYEEVKKKGHMTVDPLCYALYYTWRAFDYKCRKMQKKKREESK